MKNKFLLALALCVCGLLKSQNISFDQIFDGSLRPSGAQMGTFSSDGQSLLVTKSGKLASGKSFWYVIETKPETNDSTKLLFRSDWFSQNLDQGSLTFSEDKNYLLVETNPERIYRHSTSVLGYVVDIPNKKIITIPGRVRYPSLPAKGSNLAYVKNNNVFTLNLLDGKETAVTSDGAVNSIINGAVDWVYEEEFSMSKGLEWSPDGKYLAFYRFDESKVKEFSMDIFKGLYPSQEKWKYPKAGEANSKVDVLIYNVANQKTVWANTESQRDQYLPRIQWGLTSDIFTIQRLNRLQNFWELLFCNPETGSVQPILTEKDAAYVDITDNLIFIPNSTQFLYTSEKNGYNHIYCYDWNKKSERAVTHGNWQVNSLVGIQYFTNTIFYTSTEFSSIEDHLYCIPLNGSSGQQILSVRGNQSVVMGPNCLYFYLTSSASYPEPSYKLFLYKAISNSNLQLCNSKNCKTQIKQVKCLQDNEEWNNKLKALNFSKLEFGTHKNEEGQSLNYWMLKPQQFDSTKKYPVLMFCYGGPGNSIVRNSYGSRNFLWYQHLASKGYIVFCVDNRGTGNQGAAFKKCTYLNLGKYEQEDQRFMAKWLGKQHFIDSTRIGIWGWSFGGYLTSLCMVKSPDVFKMGMAVAPVTHWKFYDNIYTERYLRTPELNKSGYEDNSPLNFTSNLKGKYLIVHGTADDNVHFQNSTEMINAMILSGTKFDSEIYPNRNHGIGDLAAQKHLFRKLTTFVTENL